MAQTRYFNWLDDDSTFALNQRDLTLHPAGRYTGFDPVLGADMTLTLNHETTGKKVVRQDLTETPKLGTWKTKQGGIVLEDGVISLTISAADATHPRIDLIVGNHEYIESDGGATALYSVIAGTPSAIPVAPNLVNPAKQVILGSIYIPPNTSALNGQNVVYTRARKPDWYENHALLDHTDAKTELPIQAGHIIHRVAGKWVNTDFRTLTENTPLNMVELFKDSGTHLTNPAEFPVHLDPSQDPNPVGYFQFTKNHVIISGGIGVLPVDVRGIDAGAALGGIFRLTMLDSNLSLNFKLNTTPNDPFYPTNLPIKLHAPSVDSLGQVQTTWKPTVGVTAYIVKTPTHWEIFDPAQVEKEINVRVKKGGILTQITGAPYVALHPYIREATTNSPNLYYFRNQFDEIQFISGPLKWTDQSPQTNTVIATLPLANRPLNQWLFRDNLTFVCPVWNESIQYDSPKVVHVTVNFDGEIILKDTGNTNILAEGDVVDIRCIRFHARTI